MKNSLAVAEVTWLDAKDSTEIDIRDIKSSRKYLVERKTIGRLALDDDEGVVLVTDIDEEGQCEITAIPKTFLKKKVITKCK